MKKVVILSNHHAYTYNLRREIIQRLLDERFEVYLVLPYGEKVELLKKMGCEFIDLALDSRGMNPVSDLNLMKGYYSILKKVKPDVVLSYTIKPNLYGGLVCRWLGLNHIANVTGLGTAVQNESALRKILICLYRVALKKTKCLFFQNAQNQQFFLDNRLVNGRNRLIPGSGINVEDHPFEPYPGEDGMTRFLFIGRIMKEKGIEEFFEAARRIKGSCSNVEFDVVGFCGDDYKTEADQLQREGIIRFWGEQAHVHEHITRANAVVLPTYHEGMSNVLLESTSTGRPVLASQIAGCRETFDEGISGFGYEPKNADDLVEKLIRFIELPYEKKKQMGWAGRRKMEQEFDRKLVVDAYMEEVDRILRHGKGD